MLIRVIIVCQPNMDPKNFMNIEKALVGLARLKDWFEPWPLTYGLALFFA